MSSQRKDKNFINWDYLADIDMEVLDRYDDRKDVLMKLREGNRGCRRVRRWAMVTMRRYRGYDRSELQESHGDEQAGFG